jgi:hypothetical protein
MKTRTSNNPPLRSASSTPDEESPDTSPDALPLKHGLRHLEREPIDLTLLDEAERALDDIDAGRTISVEELRAKHGR